MKYTNLYNLPQGIYDAIYNEVYDIGDADYSFSNLTTPPQIRRLIQLNSDNISIDISDEIWKLFGSAVHYILDKAQPKGEEQIASHILNQIEMQLLEESDIPTVLRNIQNLIKNKNKVSLPQHNPIITEKRFNMKIAGFKISGKPDWYNPTSEKIEDYKVTSVWKVIKGDYEDWIFAQNGYKLLLEYNDLKVNGLQINTILKDWRKADLKKSKPEDNYPIHPVKVIELPVWDSLDTLTLIIERIKKHESVKHITDAEEIYKTTPCSDKDKWHKDDKYAIMKKGGKRATATFDNKEEAEKDFHFRNKDEYEFEVRKGMDLRCEEFCVVKEFCAQYKAEHHSEVIYDEQKKEVNIDDLFKDDL